MASMRLVALPWGAEMAHRPLSILDTIDEAARLIVADAVDDPIAGYDPRKSFLERAGLSSMSEADWMVMLGHLLACEQNCRSAAPPPQAMIAASQDVVC